jgi:hypothetical protein
MISGQAALLAAVDVSRMNERCERRAGSLAEVNDDAGRASATSDHRAPASGDTVLPGDGIAPSARSHPHVHNPPSL